MIINRKFAQPNKATFTMPPAREFVTRWLSGREVIVDPFARNERLGTFTNDIDPASVAQYHMEARDFLRKLITDGVKAHAIIFDPPYSPTQIARSYRNAGLDSTHPKKPLNWSSGEKNPGTFQSPGTDRSARNYHPTVKPTELMRWLCRLVTPPGGTVIDPMMGSGSTGRAAVLEGFNFIGMEKEPQYMPIARARIAEAQGPLFSTAKT